MSYRRSHSRRGDRPGLMIGSLFIAALLGGCGDRAVTTPATGAAPRTVAPTENAPVTQSQTGSTEGQTGAEGKGVGAAESLPADETPRPWEPSDGRPRDARMTIPKLGIRNLEVRSYVGRTDDAPGHAIQNTGIVASPTGADGGTGPGGVGNYQVTGHRTSSTRIFEFLPRLVKGDRIRVRAGGMIYIYRVQTTRITSFRSQGSLREQRAAVPGRPGVRPTRAKITVSTCRTQEDHAEGNFWADEFDNPEHRIDKIGVLVRTRAA